MCNLNALIARRTAIEQQLAELGLRIEASLSSMDSETDLDALFSLVTEEMVDPPDDHVASLMIEWNGLCSEISVMSSAGAKKIKFTVTVTETYTNTFMVEADDSVQAQEAADGMAIERTFPAGHVETCNRSIAVEEEA